MVDLEENEIASVTEYSGKIIRLTKDMVVLPDSSMAFREVVHVKDAVAIVAINGDKLLMVRQYRHAVGRELLELPAGRIDPLESPSQAAQRELREETGYSGKMELLGSFFSSSGFTTEKVGLYVATDLVYDPLKLDEGEFLQVEQIAWQEATIAAFSGHFASCMTTLGIILADRKRVSP